MDTPPDATPKVEAPQKIPTIQDLVENGIKHAEAKLAVDLKGAQTAISSAIKINNPRLAINHFADIAFDCLESVRNMFGMKFPNSLPGARKGAVDQIYARVVTGLMKQINQCNVTLIKDYSDRANNEYMKEAGLRREITKRKQEADSEFKHTLKIEGVLRGERKCEATMKRFEVSQRELLAVLNLLSRASNEENQEAIALLKKITIILLQEIDIPGQLDLLEATIYSVCGYRKDIEVDSGRLDLLKTKLAAIYIQICELAAKYNILGAISNASNFTPDAAISRSIHLSELIDKVLSKIEDTTTDEPDVVGLTKLMSILKADKTLGNENAVTEVLIANDFVSKVEQLKVYQSQLYRSLWGNKRYEDYVYQKVVPVTRTSDGVTHILGQTTEEFSNTDTRIKTEALLKQVSLNKRNNNRGIDETKKRLHADGKILDIYYSKQRDILGRDDLNKVAAWPEDFQKMLLALYRLDIMIGSLRNVSHTASYRKAHSDYIRLRAEKRQEAALSRTKLVTESETLMSNKALK